MKFEIRDITGNRWTTESQDLRSLRSDIKNGLELEVIPYGLENKTKDQYTQWYLMGDKVASYRQIQ